MGEWVSVGKYGLRYREHPEKVTGVGRRKRPLRYYTAVYKWQGKVVTDAYGWEGEDFHNEDAIVETALLLRKNRKAMTPPFTLRELRDEREQVIEAKAEQERQQRLKEEQEQATVLDHVFNQYCESYSHKKSLEDEIGYYRNWIAPAIGHKRLDEIILLDLERVRKKMATAGKAARSIQYVKAIVRQIYSYASIRGLFKGQPPTQHFLKQQKLDNKRQRYLSPDEANALLKTIRPHSEQTHNICLLSLNTGMRFGEIASLLWQHVNMESQSIMIIDPKNGESRSAYMTDAVVQMFSGMTRGKPDELVFPSTTGGQMGKISHTFPKTVDELGLNYGITDRRMKVVFHSLRHSCASWLVNAGVELPTIAKILGHKSLEMTTRYSHVNDTSVRNAMRTLDQQQEQDGKVVTLRSNNG
jgi:integrase